MRERRITDAFEQLATEARPRPGRWETIERRIRRRRALKLARSTILAVAVVAAVATALPRLGSLREDGFAGQDPGTTSGGSTSVHRDGEHGFQISFPSDWAFFGFREGVRGIALEHPDAEGFGIEVFMFPGTRYDDASEFGGTPFEPIDPIDGADAVRWEETVSQPAGTHRRVVFRIDWSDRRAAWSKPACTESKPTCDPGSDTMQFLITASTDEQWQELGAAAEEVVKSLVRLEHVRYVRWDGVDVFTRWGRVSPEVRYDDSTALLAQFMDVRVGGGDVERLFYDGPVQPITGFHVVERRDVERHAEFTVSVQGASETEVIDVGLGRSGDLEILDVRLVVSQADEG